MRRREAMALMALGAASEVRAVPPSPLQWAHAHNDYEHRRPLLDALNAYFCSVEADIWLVDGQLLVAHNRDQVRTDRTLESLYLKPLAEQVRRNRGHVFPDASPFWLLIDVKSDAETTFAVLHEQLRHYPSLLTSHRGSETRTRPVTAVLSGNRARATLEKQPERWISLDGRPEDLRGGSPASLVPWISTSWQPHFSWSGEGNFPEDQRTRLKALVEQTHRQGRKLRFWGTPDTPAVWQELWSAGVDLLGTDDLPGLSRFLRSRNGPPGKVGTRAK